MVAAAIINFIVNMKILAERAKSQVLVVSKRRHSQNPVTFPPTADSKIQAVRTLSSQLIWSSSGKQGTDIGVESSSRMKNCIRSASCFIISWTHRVMGPFRMFLKTKTTSRSKCRLSTRPLDIVLLSFSNKISYNMSAMSYTPAMLTQPVKMA